MNKEGKEMKVIVIVLSVFVLLTLFSCTNTPKDNEKPEKADLTSPIVVSVGPVNGDEDVPITTNVSVTFSEQMDVNSAQNAFTLSEGLNVVSGTFSWSGDTVTFNPNNDLSYNTIYYVTVSTDARDTAGNYLASAFTFEFMTAEEPLPDIKLVAIGDSITMGIQDVGLVKDYQLNDYPYLIAKQLGNEGKFKQPLISRPGFGIPPYKSPLKLENDTITMEFYDKDLTDEEVAEI